MNTQYFTKVENRIVFNVSLIFWHLFIAIAILSIIVGVAVFAWSLIPSSQKKIEKQEYPTMPPLPEPVKVDFSELNLVDAVDVETNPEIKKPVLNKPAKNQNGESPSQYDASLDELKKMIPTAKWEGESYYIYPFGQRYWDVYKTEKYREKVITEVGVADKLDNIYREAKATSYNEKKQVLDAIVLVIKQLPEEKRFQGLQFLLENISKDISQNVQVFSNIAKMVSQMPNDENLDYIQQLAYFGKNNPSEGSLCIEYISEIINNFNKAIRSNFVDAFISNYYSYFGSNFNQQKEATDLFLPMVPQIEKGNEISSLNKYYSIYINKNYSRAQEIAQIESEYQKKIQDIDSQFRINEASAIMEYQAKKLNKQEFRLKSLMGIGICILVIVLIGTFLVFLSIQRSVSKIEQKMTLKYNN
jgi:hypothetical protein